MSIKVICSRCGGIGTLKFLRLAEPHWRTEACPECDGSGRVQQLSFQERKQKQGGPTPPYPPDGGVPPESGEPA